MEYINIVYNTLIESEQINQCLKTLEKVKNDGASDIELLHTSRYLILERADFDNYSNITANLIEILNELNSVAQENNNSTGNDNTNDNSIISLQLSNILDTVFQSISKKELKIYIYRYFFMYSIDTIADQNNYAPNDINAIISSINSTIKTELKNTNLLCSSKTLLESLADIDNKYLMSAINNVSIETNTDKNKRSNKKISFSYKKVANICFAAIIIILIVANIKLLQKNKTTKTTVTNENRFTDDTYEFSHLFIEENGKLTVNIEELFFYYDSSIYSSESIRYTTENFVGYYEIAPLKSIVPLKDCIGDKVESLSSDQYNYYKLLGNKQAQYLIEEYDDSYNLFCLSHISLNSNAYENIENRSITCLEIAETFWGLPNGNYIKNITTSDQNYYSNFEDINVKRLINTDEDLQTIYNIMSECTYAPDLVAYHKQIPNDYLMSTSVQLVIELIDGTIIDSIYYRPGFHYFYDIYSNTAFLLSDNNDETTRNKLGAYLDTMLGFSHHTSEPVDPNYWHISSEITLIEADFISLTFHQYDETNFVNGLYLGEEYIIEKYENDTWIELEYKANYVPTDTFPFHTALYGNNFEVSYFINLRDKYIYPIPGKYRVCFTIYDSNSVDIDNPTSKPCYVEFELTEDNLQ